MRERQYRANAKLNLSVDVTGKREDGYHSVDLVNVSVSLSDTLTFTATPGAPFAVSSNSRFLPTGEKNLVWKAAAALAERVGTELPEVRIHVLKRIPTQAGLGGGSADAAATLVALNGMLGYGLSPEVLTELSVKIGADVPFCVNGGYARATGIGEILEPFETPCRYHLVIGMPRTGKSTRAVFEAIDSAVELKHPKTDKVTELLREGKLAEALSNASNVFQTAIPDPVTEELAERIRREGAVYAALTGTGAAVFGVFRGYKDSLRCRDELRSAGYGAWSAQPRPAGVERVDI